MKKRGIATLLVLICAFGALLSDYKLVKAYYSQNYYNVGIAPSVEHVVLHEPNRFASLAVTLKNNTRKMLSSDNNIFLSYHLLDENGNMIERDNARSKFSLINPYRTGDVQLEFATPDELGTYILELDLVEEHVAWFSEKGNHAPWVTLVVE